MPSPYRLLRICPAQTDATTPQLTTITGSPADDNYFVTREGTLLQVWENPGAPGPIGQPTYSSQLAAMNGALAIDSGNGDDTLIVNAGTEPTLGLSPLTYHAGAGTNGLVLESGNARIDSTAIGGVLNTTVQTGAQLTTEQLNQNALPLADSARAILLAGGASSKLTSLSLGAAARLDISDNALVVDYTGVSPAGSIRDQIIAGRGGAGLDKHWNGAGIASSTAAQMNATSPNAYSLGYAENALLPLGAYTMFRGQPVDGTSVLIAYTQTGDANFDGAVSDDDVTVVGASYAPGQAKPPGSAWALGDFEYNGQVDDDDITLLGAFFTAVAALVPAPLAAVGQAFLPAPEQASSPAVRSFAVQNHNLDDELLILLAEVIAADRAGDLDTFPTTRLRVGRRPVIAPERGRAKRRRGRSRARRRHHGAAHNHAGRSGDRRPADSAK